MRPRMALPRVSIPHIMFLSAATNSTISPRGRNRDSRRKNRRARPNQDSITLKPFYGVNGQLVRGFPKTVGDAMRLNGKCLKFR